MRTRLIALVSIIALSASAASVSAMRYTLPSQLIRAISKLQFDDVGYEAKAVLSLKDRTINQDVLYGDMHAFARLHGTEIAESEYVFRFRVNYQGIQGSGEIHLRTIGSTIYTTIKHLEGIPIMQGHEEAIATLQNTWAWYTAPPAVINEDIDTTIDDVQALLAQEGYSQMTKERLGQIFDELIDAVFMLESQQLDSNESYALQLHPRFIERALDVVQRSSLEITGEAVPMTPEQKIELLEVQDFLHDHSTIKTSFELDEHDVPTKSDLLFFIDTPKFGMAVRDTEVRVDTDRRVVAPENAVPLTSIAPQSQQEQLAQ